MNHYEVNFIIDPVLSGDEIKSTAGIYETLLKDQGCTIVHVNAGFPGFQLFIVPAIKISAPDGVPEGIDVILIVI